MNRISICGANINLDITKLPSMTQAVDIGTYKYSVDCRLCSKLCPGAVYLLK